MVANEIIIEAGHSERQYWRDLWRYRELFYFLAWRDLMVRYKQTALGIAWAVLRPLLTMLVFTLIFGNLAKLPSGGVPYPILILAALLPWQFFANALSESSGSLLTNANLISKVYFPRLIVPASSVIVGLVDALIGGGLLIIMLLWFNLTPDWRILTLPLFFGVAFAAALGAGLWLSALSVKYRDFRFVVPFMVQLGLYISPVGFSSQLVPEQWRWLYSLNPLVGIIDGFRWAILNGASPIYWPGFVLSMALVGLLFGSGVWYFRQVEDNLADVI